MTQWAVWQGTELRHPELRRSAGDHRRQSIEILARTSWRIDRAAGQLINAAAACPSGQRTPERERFI